MAKSSVMIFFGLIIFLTGVSANARGVPEVIRLGIVSTGWTSHLPVGVASKAGFFEEQGLEVLPINMIGDPLVMAGIFGGHVDMAISGASVVWGIAQGGAAKIVASLNPSLLYWLVGSKGLKDVRQLKGKIIGVTRAGALSEFVTERALRNLGLIRGQDYTILAIGGANLRALALEGGKIAAAPMTPPELVSLKEKGFPVLLDMGATIPNFPQTVISASNALSRDPHAVAGFLKAMIKAMRLIKTDGKLVVKLASSNKHTPKSDPKKEEAALFYYGDKFRDGNITERDIEVIIGAFVESGKMTRVKPAAVFDEQFLKKALQGLP